MKIEGYDVVVNRPKTHAYRAPGATQAEFASETVVDEICEQLGIDPLDFREKNSATEAPGAPADRLTAGSVTWSACKRPGTPTTGNRRSRSPAGTYRGRGAASGFWFNIGFTSSAIARSESGTAR